MPGGSCGVAPEIAVILLEPRVVELIADCISMPLCESLMERTHIGQVRTALDGYSRLFTEIERQQPSTSAHPPTAYQYLDCHVAQCSS